MSDDFTMVYSAETAYECTTMGTSMMVMANLEKFPNNDTCDIALFFKDIFNLFGRE
jgi:hypothetical protein